MKKSATPNQPEVTDQRIYGGGKKVEPLDAGTRESRQPKVLPNTKVHGVRKTPTIRVKVKGSTDRRPMIIPMADYDPIKHAVVKTK